jgi:hypothetical protein
MHGAGTNHMPHDGSSEDMYQLPLVHAVAHGEGLHMIPLATAANPLQLSEKLCSTHG